MERIYNRGFRSLIVWQEGKRLALKIYEMTKKFPPDERFGLVSQLRRAAGSIIANIAEGSAMKTKEHRDSFYVRARGSAVEVDCYIDFSTSLGYVSSDQEKDVQDHCARLTYLLTKLMAAR